MVKELYCPNCGSPNVFGYKGVYECADCGYRLKIISSGKFQAKHFDILRPISIILFIAALVLFTYAAIVTNILGPIEVRVVQTTTQTQFATLSLASTVPSEISAGSDLDLIINVVVKTGFSNGVLVVNVTATDFTPSTSDVSVQYSRNYFCGVGHGWYSMSASSIPGGIQFRGTQYKFTCSAGESGQVELKITFKTPNPTDSGKYRITIGIEI